MPIYQFFCEECVGGYEITMPLKTLEKYDRGKENVDCPECGTPLRKLICPPKTIRIN